MCLDCFSRKTLMAQVGHADRAEPSVFLFQSAVLLRATMVLACVSAQRSATPPALASAQRLLKSHQSQRSASGSGLWACRRGSSSALEPKTMCGDEGSLTLGTDCSGIESVGAALAEMGVPFKHEFASEKVKGIRKFLHKHWAPRKLYRDITTRNMVRVPTCDLYAAGFPCQPFSRAGKGEGVNDSYGRGRIFEHVRDYIDQRKPKAFLLENVKALTQEPHRAYFDEMIRKLGAAAGGRYFVAWKVLNTLDYGLPQNRERVYIIGLPKKTGSMFKWPRPCKQTRLGLLLQKDAIRKKLKKGTGCYRRLKAALKEIRKQGMDPKRNEFVVDVHGSNGTWMRGCVPCITRTRGGQNGHYITNHNGLLTMKELLRLQGLPEKYHKMAAKVGMTDRQLGQCVGNAMSVNILVPLLKKILCAIGKG